MPSLLEFEWAGETLTLFADRAIFWFRKSTLIIADTHFGKDATFRAAGVALPGGTTHSDLNRLTTLLEFTEARRLLLLGDFFHARRGRMDDTMAALTEWRAANACLEIVNVRGNHDIKAGDPPQEWNIRCVDEPLIDSPFAWQHHPQNVSDSFAVGGHLHPAIVLDGRGSTALKAPCFWFRERSAILPSFGEFTGSSKILPRRGDQIFAVNGQEILQVLTK